MTRIVSLLPSNTEIVCALGCGDLLVGRSHECDFPASVTQLPICTAPKFSPEGSSSQIDQRVKALLQERLSIYRVDADVLKDLRPSVIITQSQCEVCAASEDDIQAAVTEWLDAPPTILSLAPRTLDDVWNDVHRIGEAIGVTHRSEPVVRALRDRVASIVEQSEQRTHRPRVACIEWLDPLMAAGNWVPELVELAGGSNQCGEAGEHSPWLTWDDLCRVDPEVIVLMPCGYDMARTQRELTILTQHPAWNTLSAVRATRVYLTDGNQYFNRPGPRLLDSLEILAEILHPEVFVFGHEGHGWRLVV